MRLFIAIDINNDVRAAVAKLQQELAGRMKNQSGLKWVSPELMHLTLKFLGEVDESRVDEICSAVEIACAGKKVFEFSFSAVGTFGRPAKVLWLGSSAKGASAFGETSPFGGEKQSPELVKLAADLEQVFSELGFEKETRPFSAHLTLARVHPHTYSHRGKEIKNRANSALSENLEFSRSRQIGVGVKDNGVDKNLRQLLKNYTQVRIPKVLVDSVCLYKSQLTPHLPNIHKIEQKEGAGLTSDGPVYTLLRKIELTSASSVESKKDI